MLTTFDKKREEAKEAIKTAIKCLQICTDEDTDGYEDMKSDYIETAINVTSELLIIHRKL